MKKKILSLGVIAILIVMLVTLTGCGNNSTENNNGDANNSPNNAKEAELYPVKDGESGKYGYVDDKGKWVIEPKYESASGFDSETGLAKVWTSNKDFMVGFINKKGEMVIEDKYGRGTKSFYNGYAVVATENKGGSSKTYSSKMLIDKNQKVIIPDGKYTEMTDVSKNGIIGVVYDSGMEYIKLDGTLAFERKTGSHGTAFNANGIAAVETNILSNSYILIDEQGNQIGNKTYGKITKLNDNNYGFANSKGYFGIVNGTGELLSDAIYYATSEFNNSNIAMVQESDYKNPWYLINSEGKKINNTTYKSYQLMLDGKWVVTLEDGKHQVLNADGSILVDTF